MGGGVEPALCCCGRYSAGGWEMIIQQRVVRCVSR